MKKRLIIVLYIFFSVCIFISETLADENLEQSTGKTYAIIVSGLIKDPQERLSKADAISELRQFLLDKTAVELFRIGPPVQVRYNRL
ncbi:hypothetical protein ACFLZ8_03605, partial [Planctomycetota bacterium]